MITAHLPAGYVTGRCFASRGPVLAAALLGGILPDFDLIWFYWIEHRAFHHHAYWVHIPLFWTVVAALCLPVIGRWQRHWLLPAIAFLRRSSCTCCLTVLPGISNGYGRGMTGSSTLSPFSQFIAIGC